MNDKRLKSVTGPCQNCQDRHPGCHGECIAYLNFRKEREEVYERRKAAMDAYSFTLEVRKVSMKRHMEKERGRRR